jgi:uncharacterized Fe-S cluster protein YjdI/predicted GNAT family acetyltransferase
MARKTYSGPEVDVSFDLNVCQHAAECVRGLPQVFNTQARPWINAEWADTPEKADKVREVVARCPSGALHIEEHVTEAPVADEPISDQPPSEGQVELSRNEDKDRYEAHIDGKLAGFAEYQLTHDLIVFTHTEVDEQFEGLGVGSVLARFALDDVRARGDRKVLPLCPFINGWIARHRDYADLVM